MLHLNDFELNFKQIYFNLYNTNTPTLLDILENTSLMPFQIIYSKSSLSV